MELFLNIIFFVAVNAALWGLVDAFMFAKMGMPFAERLGTASTYVGIISLILLDAPMRSALMELPMIYLAGILVVTYWVIWHVLGMIRLITVKRYGTKINE
jgi:hypothetical protein